MTSFFTDPWGERTSMADAVEAAGIAPPSEWSVLRAPVESFGDTMATPLRDRIVAAVLDPTDNIDIATMRAMALAESSASSTAAADLNNDVRRAVLVSRV